MRVRRITLVAGTVVGAVVLSACSSGSSSSDTTTTTTSAASATTTRASSPSTTHPSATSTTSAGPATCPSSGLAGSISGSSGAAGTIESTVALKSTTASPCVMSGYPGMQLLDSSGNSLPTNVVRKGNYSFTAMAPTTVTLTTGQTAYFNIGYSDVPTGSETSCPSSSSVEITPPNDTTHLVVAANFAPCGAGTLVVSPVFAAGTNTQTTAPGPG
jgi:Protein of unknown function (DUF4232)